MGTKLRIHVTTQGGSQRSYDISDGDAKLIMTSMVNKPSSFIAVKEEDGSLVMINLRYVVSIKYTEHDDEA